VKLTWIRFVDIATIIWLALFISTFFISEVIGKILEMILLAILVIFIMDLIFFYQATPTTKHFFKKHWFDILLVIPYFRVLRVFRMLRLLKIAKTTKAIKALRKGQNIIKKH